jgi:hypothetical protein
VTGDGEVVLSPLFDVLYDTGQPLVFSADASGDGTVYLGTGHEGRVYRVAPDGTGTLLADLGELDVLALAVGPGGDVFAGTSPEGSVYRIDGDGNAILFFDPEDT